MCHGKRWDQGASNISQGGQHFKKPLDFLLWGLDLKVNFVALLFILNLGFSRIWVIIYECRIVGVFLRVCVLEILEEEEKETVILTTAD